ncbi:MAG: CRTAC1 family protein [Myxococcales bacterium]|nr:CRTAC1 family protein [Myxococcales bacterium]
MAAFCLLLAATSGCSSSGSASDRDQQIADDASDPADRQSADGNGADAFGADGLTDDLSSSDTTPFACTVRDLVVPTTQFFVDISKTSGIRDQNQLLPIAQKVPINDHSRLGFVDIDGDGFDDIVMHSLFPNPQAGIPFEHLVFLNKGNGTFQNVSDQSGLRNVQSAFFAFADIDNDGDQDCFAGIDIAISGETHQILLNDGNGHFTPLAGSGLDDPSIGPVMNAIFGDFDNDGKLDLYLGRGGTTEAAKDMLFLGNGDGTFRNATERLIANPTQPSNGTVTCDFDNDGDLDIFVSTYGVSVGLGLNILWRNDGTTFTNVAIEKRFASLPGGNYWLDSTGNGTLDEPSKTFGSYMGSNGFGIDCGDVDNDGNMDIFLTTISHPVDADYSRKWSDPTQLLLNQGPTANYTFQNVFLERKLPFNEGDVDGALVDFDNDGRLDLSISRDKKYEGNYSDEEQKAWFGLMHQMRDGTFESLGIESGINAPTATLSASMTECIDDTTCSNGEACLFARCRRGCASDSDCPSDEELCVSVWNDALGAPQQFCKLRERMKNAQNHAWADIDGDGDLDLLVGGRDTGGGRSNFLFRNEIGSQNRWISLRLVGNGTTVNRDAIGARITLRFADNRSQIREVRSSRGMYNSLDTRALHFGLGDFSCEYEMLVRWPDGVTTTIPAGSFPENTRLRLDYPAQISTL